MTRFRSALARMAAALTLFAAAQAHALDTDARAAFVMDLGTGAVLLAKNSDEPIPPASMSKLMTLDLVFEAIADGRLSLSEKFRVSEKAWRLGGSKMFLREGDRVSVEDLIRGVVIQSGNDACVVLAEGLAGSEEAFAERMTQRAHELGMTSAHFVNATGWPHPDHLISTRDLAFLAERLITEFPDLYHYFDEREFEWEGVRQSNRNPLLGLGIGVDGLKTGHTEDAGYGLVASAERDGRRIILVINGLESAKARAIEGERLVNWAFREFQTGTLYAADEPIAAAEVWIGESDAVPLVSSDDVRVTVPFGAVDRISATVRYDGPVEAPIAKGQQIAELVIEAPGAPPVIRPLVAGADVARGGLFARLRASAVLALGLAAGAEPVRDPEFEAEPEEDAGAEPASQ